MSIRYDLELEGIPARQTVRQVHGQERLHRPWRYELAVEPDRPLDWTLVEEWLGRGAALRASGPGSLDTESGVVRRGVVTEVQVTDTGVRVTLVSRLALFEVGQDYRVFLDRDAVEIARELLAEQSLLLESRVTRRLPKRRQTVQCWESTLAFVSRILAEEGIVLVCAPDGSDAIHLVDSPDGFVKHPGAPLTLRRECHKLRDLTDAGSVLTAEVSRRLRAEAVTERDFSPAHPALNLLGTAGNLQSPRERYEFHGGFDTPEAGKAQAGRRLAAYRRDAASLEFLTSSRDLAPGLVVEVEAEESAVAGRWLVVEVVHQGLETEESPDKGGTDNGAAPSAERDYQATVKAVPAELGYRELSLTRDAPRAGLETATVVGPAGVEIHPDPEGRVKTRHRWDRIHSNDDKASAWHRVAHPALSGALLLPRVGWEELTGYWGSGTDEPIALGRLGHGEAPPPAALPHHKLWSAFGTPSTPGGGPGNRIAFNDQAGAEGLHLNAGGAMTDKTAQGKTTSVAAVETHSVSGSRTLTTGKVHSVSVSGAQSYTVGARKVAVEANKIVNAASETVTVAGARKFTVGGMQSILCDSLTRLVGGAKGELCTGGESRTVAGASTVLVGGLLRQTTGGAQGINVAGANNEIVAGVKSITAAGSYTLDVRALIETYGARQLSGSGVSFDYGSRMGVTAGTSAFTGSEIVFTATSQITISAGGATITITPGSVTIDAEYKNSGSSSNSSSQDYG